MRILRATLPWKVLALLTVMSGSVSVHAQLHPEEVRRIQWHGEGELSRFSRPPAPAPVTVASEDAIEHARLLPLDDAIRMALEYSEVIRVLTGTGAAPSGRTIYDPAIATTSIDQAVARFDPTLEANANFLHTETPRAGVGTIFDSAVGSSNVSANVSQSNRLGGEGRFGVGDLWSRTGNTLFLNPTNAVTLELSYTQKLLNGFGRDVNEVPIVIARLQLDQSYFQFRSAMQTLVQGVITGYWSLVQARTELWAREKQLEQTSFALQFGEANQRAGFGTAGDVSQARVAYNNLRANLIAARANVLQREAALRNLIGLPPEDGTRLVPSTPPTRDRLQFRWEDLVRTAQSQRPDLIELNLILMADQQRLLQSRNSALPSLDATALHRWNGLEGRLGNNSWISSAPDNHTDWTLGVTFSVPVGLRQARAALRSQELIIARDRANVQQSLHQIEHLLATSLRTIDQNYLQYEAFSATRDAARTNVLAQFERYRAGLRVGGQSSPFLNVLQAIADWGNAVSSEAQSLANYNTELATLELQTGTILQTHGVTFVEEQFGSIGPWGRHFELECYPRSLSPAGNAERYEDSGKPAEEAFGLDDYPERNRVVPPEPPQP